MAEIKIPFHTKLVDSVRDLFEQISKLNDLMGDIGANIRRETQVPMVRLDPSSVQARYQKFSQGLRFFETYLSRSTEMLLRPLSASARIMFRTLDVTRILSRTEGLMGSAQLVPLSGLRYGGEVAIRGIAVVGYVVTEIGKFLIDTTIKFAESTFRDSVSASGLGLSIGQYRAFMTVFGPVPGTAQALERTALGMADQRSKAFMIMRLLNVKRASVTGMTMAGMVTIQKMLRERSQNQIMGFARSIGLTDVYPEELIRALGTMTLSEMKQRIELERQRERDFYIPEPAIKAQNELRQAWQTFLNTMETSWINAATHRQPVFGTGRSTWHHGPFKGAVKYHMSLLEAYTELTSAAGSFIVNFIKSPLGEDLIRDFVKVFKRFVEWLQDATRVMKEETSKKFIREAGKGLEGPRVPISGLPGRVRPYISPPTYEPTVRFREPPGLRPAPAPEAPPAPPEPTTRLRERPGLRPAPAPAPEAPSTTFIKRALQQRGARKLPRPVPAAPSSSAPFVKRALKERETRGLPRPSPTSATPAQPRATKTYTGGGNQQKVGQTVANELRKKGWSENAINGILYNIGQESSFDPTLRHPDQPRFSGEAHYAHGLYQEGGSDWYVWERQMRARGIDPATGWSDPKEATRFMDSNINPKVKAAMNAAKTPEEAADIFASHYLRPAAPYLASRRRNIYSGGVKRTEQYTGPSTGEVPPTETPQPEATAPQGTPATPQKYTSVGPFRAPQPTTQQDTRPGAGGSVKPLEFTPGRHPDVKDVDPRLLESVSAGATHLPPGYKVTVNEGYNPYGHAPLSQHHILGKGALDVHIVDPSGNVIPNEGSDYTGMYTRLARGTYGEMLARHPELKGSLAWGGAFGASRGNAAADLMHFDIGGERGKSERYLSHLGVLPGELYGGKQPEQKLEEPKPKTNEDYWKEADKALKKVQEEKNPTSSLADHDTYVKWHKRRQPIKIVNDSSDVDIHQTDVNSELSTAPM